MEAVQNKAVNSHCDLASVHGTVRVISIVRAASSEGPDHISSVAPSLWSALSVQVRALAAKMAAEKQAQQAAEAAAQAERQAGVPIMSSHACKI